MHMLKQSPGSKTYVLFHILLASVKGSLAHVQTNLCGGVVHEASESRMHIITALLLRHTATLLSVSISTLGL